MTFVGRILTGALFLISPAAFAASVTLAGCGINALGCFQADATYSGGTTSATMDIRITNTSSGGWLTAFAFNNPGSHVGPGRISSVSLTGAPTSFQLIGNSAWDDGINASPLGQFDIGASTSSSWEGSGRPSLGLAAGASALFRFTLTGNLTGLTIAHFFGSLLDSTAGAYSEGPGIGSYGAQVFAVRFRGFACEPLCAGSDKAPGSVVPIPPAVALFLTGLAGLAAWRRRALRAAS